MVRWPCASRTSNKQKLRKQLLSRTLYRATIGLVDRVTVKVFPVYSTRMVARVVPTVTTTLRSTMDLERKTPTSPIVRENDTNEAITHYRL